MPDYTSPMWEAFMKDQKFTDKQAADIKSAKDQFQHDRESDAIRQLSRSQKIADYTNIPATVTPEDLKQKTESHPKMKHDHSLDRVRTVEDMVMPEPEPEGLRLCPKGLPSSEFEDPNDMPDFSIDWDSLGNQLGL